ncbi:MAG: T9SS type A sorting domain-containing protein [Sporocytophaga sp.]|uniref:T9SS type A sorting domain-containing protein n=1 Tax=Sporocytophaga sp. TaxID=2231183 RepID=UPI001B1C5C17|nr:T9SS type A sorting domain-containing protein [Sporocytophaga sp.]MBO9699445.1 T9SS type A sorting domain-containing protein [Sporocytophaga sp.]
MDKRYRYITSRPGQECISLDDSDLITFCLKKIKLENTRNVNLDLTLKNEGEMNFSVLNVLGKTVFHAKKYFKSGFNNFNIGVEKLERGVYFIELLFQGKSFVKKMVLD